MDWFSEHIATHWPFITVCAVLWVIGHFMATSVFTKARSLKESKHGWFWWWGRASMELHPVAAGVLIGILWQNPEQADPAWPWIATLFYFMAAGVSSLFGWKLIVLIAKRLGFDLSGASLPGESKPPEEPK